MQRNKSADKWPSSSTGFHTRVVEYSRKTHDLIKLLMAEQRMSMFQQSKINSYLRSGLSLPKMIVNQKTSRKICNSVPHSMFAMATNRRTLDAIKASGDLDREQYIPKRFESREQKKYQLQEQMSGLKHFSPITGRKCIQRTFSDDEYQIDPTKELLHEIQERLEWIGEMDKLGEGYEYKQVMRNEIAERLRFIKSYDSQS